MDLIPLEFLLDASVRSLEDLELAALNRSANFSKTLRVELEAWAQEQAGAMVARWFIEHRQELLRMTSSTVQPHKVEMFPDRKRSA